MKLRKMVALSLTAISILSMVSSSFLVSLDSLSELPPPHAAIESIEIAVSDRAVSYTHLH